jgi:hypothetical protein
MQYFKETSLHYKRELVFDIQCKDRDLKSNV